ncbi:MAG: hypothetical protein DRN91_04780 [Candidatus Alkanophagales archaeon]|nr:MAG: hypothetical protein DRN91_04780 [Candidatus Alkanophagales archaeon]
MAKKTQRWTIQDTKRVLLNAFCFWQPHPPTASEYLAADERQRAEQRRNAAAWTERQKALGLDVLDDEEQIERLPGWPG